MSVSAPPTSSSKVDARSLTDEQEEAVARRAGGLLLAANAGSGKTTVLVERFVRAVHEDGVAPSRILAITFTERAAGELRERVRRRLEELGDRRGARETETAFVSTIHGFCARLLRVHPLTAGLPPGFGVLDEGTASGLRRQAFERALAAWMVEPAALDLAAACGVDRLAAAVMGVHDELRSQGRTRPALPAAALRHDVGVARASLAAANRELAAELAGSGGSSVRVAGAMLQLACDPLVSPLAALKLHRGANALKTPTADAYEAARRRCCEAEADARGVVRLELLRRLLDGFTEEFAAVKRARGGLDFDDLELCARDLLSGDAELRGRWSERFELLMVDELQDTNPREMAILGALDRGNLFTVGDEFQSIYGFRHADVGIFRRRRRELAGADAVRVLSRNFRTRPALIGAINAAFAPLLGDDFVPLVAGRDDGPDAAPLLELMVCDTAGWEDTDDALAPGVGPPWRRAEAALLARRIDELIAAGVTRPGEIVVLLRYATAASVYERALAARGVPVAPAPGGGFYAAQVVADLAAYARVLANPLDEPALYGVLASPLCGLGADGLAVVGLAGRALGRAPWEVLEAAHAGEPAARVALDPLGDEDRVRLEACRALIAGERAAAPGLGLADLLVRSGYRERAAAGQAGLANLRKLLRLTRDYEAREGRDLRRFADRLAAGRLAAAREQEAASSSKVDPGAADVVRLMTVHAAKGLEFPVVCVADLGHGPPIGGPLILTDGERVGLRLPTLDGTPREDALAYADLKAGWQAAAVAEEQRIVYVAVTRARERLILSGAAHFARWPAAGPAAAAMAWVGPALVPDIRDRVGGALGVSELELGGAPLRLTLTASSSKAGAGTLTVSTSKVADELAQPVHRDLARLADVPRAETTAVSSKLAQLSLFVEPEAAAIVGDDASVTHEVGARAPWAASGVTPPPSSVSYSSLSDFARCGYGYYLRRVVGLAEVAPPPADVPAGLDPAVRGQIVHALLERLDFVRPVAPPAERVRAEDPGLDDDEVALIAGLVGGFARSPLCRRLAAATGIAREASFALTLGDLLVGGYIDALGQEADGRLLVVDYKTDRVEQATDLAARVAGVYDIQRRIYGLAGLRAGAPSVEVAYCFLRRPDEVVSVHFDAADAVGLERGLVGLTAPLRAGRFDVSQQPHRGLCATCPGRARLCSWDETMTLREQAAVHGD